MGIRVEQRGNVAVIAVVGALALQENAAELAVEVTRLFDGGTRNVLVDLSEVSKLDSFGLGALARAYTKLSRDDGRLALVAPTAAIRTTLELTRVDRVIESFGSVEEGVAAFTRA